MRGAAGLAALLMLLALTACGRSQPDDGASEGGGPVGVWTLDREALLEAVRRRHGKEGGEELAREVAQASLLEVDAELRADGRYGLRTRAFDGPAEACAGRWSLEGHVLTFRPQIIDGKDVTADTVERARFEDDRILLPFDAVGLTFPLKRK